MNNLQVTIRSIFSLLAVFMVLGLASCSSGGSKSPANASETKQVASGEEKAPVITFDKTQHEFGTIFIGEKVAYNFRFTNTGNAPLIIINARSGCGCTVGDYPKEPIPPGGSARINVTFNSAGRRGFQSESVRVVTNATPQEYVLRITAEVIQN